MLNYATAACHLVQCVAVICVYALRLRHVPSDMAFVSGYVSLLYPNHMVHVLGGNGSACSPANDVIRSAEFAAALQSGRQRVLQSRGALDLANTTVVEFYRTDLPYAVNTPAMMAAFFALSFAFQAYNGWYIGRNGLDAPRIVPYLEYAVSSPLMILTMAVSAGIVDLVTGVTLFVLFFGMNILGAVAELMMYIAETAKEPPAYHCYCWLLPHLSAWVLFLFALLPIVVQFYKVQRCCQNSQGDGAPWFVTAAICAESALFVLFGALQLYVLCGRSCAVRLRDRDLRRWFVDALDTGTVALSLTAKTFLAWILLGPALTATPSQ
jgi:hypothetical protein